MLDLPPSSTLFCGKHSSCFIVFVFVFFSQLLCKVPYSLSIISLVLITELVIL